MMLRFLSILATLVCMAVTVHAQYVAYYELNDMPNGVKYLPPPPDEESAQFEYDKSQYEWGKTLRDTERGAEAVEDSRYFIDNMCRLYSEAFGMTLSNTATPAIYNLLYRSLLTISYGTYKCKTYYKRQRPYQYFNEDVASGETLTDPSYPSAHTTRGWAMSLLLVAVNPNAQEALLKRGYEFGQSRVIVGAHWQSDVDAGRLVASAGLARLLHSKDFLSDLVEAQKEFNHLSAVEEVHADLPVGEERWYTIDGRPATPQSRGILVGPKGKKIVR